MAQINSNAPTDEAVYYSICSRLPAYNFCAPKSCQQTQQSACSDIVILKNSQYKNQQISHHFVKIELSAQLTVIADRYFRRLSKLKY